MNPSALLKNPVGMSSRSSGFSFCRSPKASWLGKRLPDERELIPTGSPVDVEEII